MTGKNKKAYMYMQGAIIQARNYQCSIIDGFKALRLEGAEKMLNDIREYGACYLNYAGGSTFSIDYDNFCRRNELIFPNFQISDIRIKQFNKGQHYYAYVGDMQVRDGDVLKWNSYDEAYTRACTLVGGEINDCRI